MNFLEYLFNNGVIREEIYQEVKIKGDNCMDYLFEHKLLNKEVLIKYIKQFYMIDYVDLKKQHITEEIIRLIPENLIMKYELIAFDNDGEFIKIAVSKPHNYVLDEDLDIMLHPMKIKKYFAFSKEILAKIESINKSNVDNVIDDNLKIDDGAFVQIVDRIIRSALSKEVSDIHLEPIDKRVRVRFRVDGDLEIQKEFNFPIGEYSGLVSRVKVLADMDPTKSREAQDGRIANYELDGQKYDLRISSLPTVYGEKIVMRVLEDKSQIKDFRPLGFSEKEIETLDKMLEKDNGILLITGETGSGKSTTLYAILNKMNNEEVNICTVENPVESSIPGVNQVQVNPQAGITFSSALRTFLRQDPDIVVVGETRDTETAKTAVDAANTGHYVLSTIHTNNATTTINRLIAMGIEPYKLADNIAGIISQKLIKKVCPFCQESHNATEKELSFLKKVEEKYQRKIITGNEVFYKGTGCSECKDGYKGRVVIMEMLLIDDIINELIASNLNSTELRKEVAKNQSFLPFELEAIEKAKLGKIDIKDVIRMFN
ncbi:GspE/PulE family protein [Alkaliphilus sp. B6464]|uniref:GspE/PulE family protein n=1 Tax=Alkaliphilus sp. B6464 TaxID=2731219 RepID=UPI001BAD06D6|nr:GspE/PulE family protein [Alkaliphilus sp. B6464]QUH22132.1 type II/IV secretion system protein [Alkaliphilus sp. B6464]